MGKWTGIEQTGKQAVRGKCLSPPDLQYPSSTPTGRANRELAEQKWSFSISATVSLIRVQTTELKVERQQLDNWQNIILQQKSSSFQKGKKNVI